MGKPVRLVLIAVGAILALIVLAAICVPLFLNTDSFKAKIESTLTKSLGRKVTIGKVDLSVLSGSLKAENTVVADDPRFTRNQERTGNRAELAPLLHKQLSARTSAECSALRVSSERATSTSSNASSPPARCSGPLTPCAAGSPPPPARP